MTTEPVALVRQFIDSYNERSLREAAESLFASDLEVVNRAARVEVQGIDAFLDHVFDGWIRAVPDARVELVDYAVHDTVVTFTMRSTGSFEGPLETPEGTVDGTGERFETAFRVEATVSDGRIGKWVSEYDVADWQRQVGLA